MVRVFYFVLIALTYRVTNACNFEDDFVCSRSGECVESVDVCDGIEDCLDGEDETVGCELYYNCTPPSKFLCEDKKCIPRTSYCDGNKDCEDGSDEIDCPDLEDEFLVIGHCPIGKRKFLCANDLLCINMDRLCDGRDDCLDGSDEGGLCLEKLLNKTCHCHNCVRTPKEDLCTCNEGYTPVNNSCEDFDECSLPHICDHHCTNTPGSYRCSCAPHYILQPNGRSCVKEPLTHQNQSVAFLYVTAQFVHALLAPHFRNISVTTTSFHMRHLTFFNEDIFRADSLDEAVFLGVNDSRINKFSVSPYFKRMCPSIIQTATDFGTSNIYVACEPGDILACDWSLVRCVTVRPANKNAIKRIALSPFHGLIFWIERNRTGIVSIVRSSMSGINHDEKVIAHFSYFGDLYLDIAVDSASRRVFFFNPRKNDIESVNFDGTGLQVFKSGIHQSLALVVYEEELFWSSSSSNLLLACDKHSGKNVRVVVQAEAPIESLILNKPRAEEVCSERNCSDMCLLTSEETENGPVAKPTCVCSYSKANVSLSPDGFSCPYTTVLASNIINGNKNYLFVIGSIFSPYPKTEKIELDDVYEISCMAYDPFQANVFLSDSKEKILYAFNLKTGNLSAILTNVNLNSMVYDGRSNNLYFINEDTEAIEALSLKTKRKATLVRKRAGEKLMAFSVDLTAGVIFIAFKKTINGTDGTTFFTAVSLNDTTTKQEIIFDHFIYTFETTTHRLVVDDKTNLVWLPLISDLLIGLGYNSSGGAKIISISDRASDLALENGIIFYTTRSSAKIEWVDWGDTEEKGRSSSYDVVAEEGNIVARSNLKIAPVTGLVNTSSPCFRNNGGCDHVCLIVNTKNYAKRCLCEEGYSLTDDGLHCHRTGPVSNMNSMEEPSGQTKSASKMIPMEEPSSSGTSLLIVMLFVFVTTGAFLFVYYRTNLGLHLRYRFIIVYDRFRQKWRGFESSSSSTISHDV